MKKIATVAVMALATLGTGCASQTYLVSNGAGTQPSYSENQTFFLGGIGQEKEINAAEVCNGASNVGKIETQQSPLNIVLGMLTQSIYTPLEVKVYCK